MLTLLPIPVPTTPLHTHTLLTHPLSSSLHVSTHRLSASLEGRKDNTVHEQLEKGLMKVGLIEYKEQLETELQKLTLKDRQRQNPSPASAKKDVNTHFYFNLPSSPFASN